MSLADWVRRAGAGVGQGLRGRRPGVELVRVDQPELPAPPPRPRPRRALPAPERLTLYRCPRCGERHQPLPMGGGGLAAAMGRPLETDPYSSRPTPLNREADTTSLRRDAFNPWRGTPAEEPPAPPITFRERMARLWGTDLFDQPDQPARPAPTRPDSSPAEPDADRPAGRRMIDVARAIARTGRVPSWWPWQ